MRTDHQNKAVHPCNSALLKEYLDFLRTHRGLAHATISMSATFVAPFLEELGLKRTPGGVEGIAASRVHDYVIKKAKSMTRAARKHLVSSLRSFLRFCHVRGYTDRNLADAIPVISTP